MTANHARTFGSSRPQVVNPAPVFLTVAEVAGRLRVSPMSVYRLVHAEELAAVRVGRSYRVSARALEAFLRGATTGGGL